MQQSMHGSTRNVQLL